MACRLPSSWKVIAFTVNMLLGLVVAQVLGATLEKDAYKKYVKIITVVTMWALSFIMINVGYEFTIDKQNLRAYFNDYLIAMTAAGFPWLFVGLWFFLVLGVDLPFDESLLIARFAAPTSAGILFSMLDAAGLKDTWVYQKARILAIFDDLDTIILMIPLKILLVGFKWELTVIVGIMAILLIFSWVGLHKLQLPYSWPWTIFYAAIVAAICKVVHHVTEHDFDMEPIHIEVLLPAFVIGTVIDTPCAAHELHLQRTMTSILSARKSSQKSLKSGCSISLDNKLSIKGSIEEEKESQADDDNTTRKPAEKTDPPPPLVTIIGPTPPGWVGEDAITPAKAPPQNAILLKSPSSENTRKSPMTLSPAFASESGRSGRTGSKTSTTSQRSGTSTHSSGGLTRYGQSREEARRFSKQQVQPPPQPEAEPVPEAKSCTSCISEWEDKVQLIISLIFMVLVGLSMPALVGKNAKDYSGGLGAGTITLHVVCVSILMVVGKMFPVLCYSDESDFKGRLALCLGMCPRGEVGASIIVISLELGVEGPAVIIAMTCLACNLIMSGAFIATVKLLLKDAPPFSMEAEQVIQTPVTAEKNPIEWTPVTTMESS